MLSFSRLESEKKVFHIKRNLSFFILLRPRKRTRVLFFLNEI